MLNILQAKLQQFVNQELLDVPAGFQRGRGTRDQIANMCWIMVKARELQKKVKERKWGLSVVSDSATPRTVAYQAPPSMGFSRQEYWSGLPLPSPGDLPNPEIKPRSPPPKHLIMLFDCVDNNKL